MPRHRTLTFFFDGVPPLDEKSAGAAKDSISHAKGPGEKVIPTQPEKPKIHYHEPFLAKKCGICHDQNTMGKFIKPQPMLCFQCHDDFSKKYKVLHGPIGGGNCTACHDPHSAPNEKLLQRVNQQLCYYCHSAVLVKQNVAHKSIADASCTTCHNPHGGKDRNMLK